jgi:TolB protein
MNEARFIDRRRFLVATGSTVAMLAGRSAWAQRLGVGTEFQPIPIAIPNFAAGSPADGQVGADVAGVITNNLKRSGLFAPIDPAAFIQRTINPDDPPQLQNWKTINAQALVVGRVTRQSDGRLKAEFRLWDVVSGQQLAGQQYQTAPE